MGMRRREIMRADNVKREVVREAMESDEAHGSTCVESSTQSKGERFCNPQLQLTMH